MYILKINIYLYYIYLMDSEKQQEIKETEPFFFFTFME